MTSPRKFAEKIALMQQKQAEGDAAFQTIIYEVEAAKKKAERSRSNKHNSDVLNRKQDRTFQESNGLRSSDRNNHSLNVEYPNGSDRLLQPPENVTWRRTHSDSSLHQAMMPTVVANYHARLEQETPNQPMNFEPSLDPKFDFPNYSYPVAQATHYPMSNSHFQPSSYQYDLNNNNSYTNGQMNPTYPFASAPATPSPQTMPTLPTASATTNHQPQQQHTLLAGRFSGGNSSSNVLMLPPNHNARANGGSLPDLRTGNGYHQPSPPMSYSTISSPPTTQNQRFFRSASPQPTSDGEFFTLGPQQLPSNIGPLRSSPSMRRRHSPIGDVRHVSPRRQNSPTPDVSNTAQTNYRAEPSSPQSQSSYSPQNSPHLISSPVGNENNSYSPPSLTENQQNQPYSTLPNHFDRITLDPNNGYAPQANVSATSPSHDHSSSTNNLISNENYFSSNNSYQLLLDDLSVPYTPSSASMTTSNPTPQKSPTIPNIILTGVDSSKLDLSDEFDTMIDPLDLVLDTDDFLLTGPALPDDSLFCDQTFQSER